MILNSKLELKISFTSTVKLILIQGTRGYTDITKPKSMTRQFYVSLSGQ